MQFPEQNLFNSQRAKVRSVYGTKGDFNFKFEKMTVNFKVTFARKFSFKHEGKSRIYRHRNVL